jgi:hypothetical protein
MIANYVKAGLICLRALGMSNNSVAQTSGTPILWRCRVPISHGRRAPRAFLRIFGCCA